MLQLFTLKNQKQGGSGGGGAGSTNQMRQTAAQLRIQKDMNELQLPGTCKLDTPDPDNLLHFTLTISPDEGYYRGGSFLFDFSIGHGYPHDAPKVKCLTPVYHPNIDTDGNICLNILREDWKPVLTISAVVYGLQYLFLEPNAEDPLNKEAAELLQSNKRQFEINVQRQMKNHMYMKR